MADVGHRATARGDNSKYRIIEYIMINSECIDIEIDNIIIDGIQMRLTGSGRNNDVIDPEPGNRFIIKNCFIWLDLSSGAGSGIDPKSEVSIFNCIFKGSTCSGILAKTGANIEAYNNTFIGWTTAIESEAIVKAVNNIFRGASGVAYSTSDVGIFTPDSDCNSSENSGDAIVDPPRNSTQSPWFSGATMDSAIFIDASDNDYHLKPEAIFIDVGIGPMAAPDVSFWDIENDPRSGPTTDMSAISHPLSKNSPLYDFTISQSQAYGTNPMKELSTGIWGMISGDGYFDGKIDEFDKNLVWRVQNGTTRDYPKSGDFNLDGE